MTGANVIEIEVDGPNNKCLAWAPTGEIVRGRWLWHRIKDAMAGMAQNIWGESVPGQVIGLNLDMGEGYIREPLYAQEHESLRKKIEQKKMILPPPRQSLKAHVPTWVYWMKRAIEDGLAALVPGSAPLPDLKSLKEKPRMKFAGVSDRAEDPAIAEDRRRMLDTIDRQQAQLDRIGALNERQSEQIAALLESRGHNPNKGQGK